MRHILSLLGLLMALLLAPSAPAATYPAVPQGPVYDGANVLPPDREAALDTRLREYNQRTGRALVVATVPSLEGESIEIYTVKLFEAWGIGGKQSDSGLLLLVAPSERQVRIETGYGLHGYITDGFAGRVIRNEITPKFKAGDMPGGIEAGVTALTAQLDRTPADAQAVAEAADAAAAQEASRGSEGGSAIGGAFVWIVIFIIVMAIFGRRRGGRRSGIDPGVVLWGLSELARGSGSHGSGWSSGGSDFGGGGGFGGFGGGGSGGGGASGSW